MDLFLRRLHSATALGFLRRAVPRKSHPLSAYIYLCDFIFTSVDNKFERNAKEWTRHYVKQQPIHAVAAAADLFLPLWQCAPQTNGERRKKKHVKGGDYPEEGWMGPCGVNEVTCHVSGYDDNGLLTCIYARTYAWQPMLILIPHTTLFTRTR